MPFLVHLCLRTKSLDRKLLTQELVLLEVSQIHEMLASGKIRQAWKKNDGLAVVLLFETSDEAECRAQIGNLPFSQAGVLQIEIIVPVEPYLDVFPFPEQA